MARGLRKVGIVSGANIATAAAGTAKSVLAMIAPASGSFKLTSFGLWVSDVNTASFLGYVLEVCTSTQAGAGTSSSLTPFVKSGPGAALLSGAKAYSAEPTVLTVKEEWPLDPNKGWVGYTYANGDEVDCPAGGAIILRLTVPSSGSGTGNVRGHMDAEE